MVKLAFLYNNKNPYLCQLRPNTNFMKFYFGALSRLSDVRVDYYGCPIDFDCSIIGSKYDAVIFFDVIDFGISENIKNIHKIKAKKILSVGDAHAVECRLERIREWEIDYCYYQHTPNYFYRYAPSDIKYWWIPIGVDPVLYRYVKPWDDRKKEIIITGHIYGFRKKLADHSRVVPILSGSYHRRSYNSGQYDGDMYKVLLENYCVSVASGWSVVMKYFEIPASGCLSVCHVDNDNGCRIIGFDESMVYFINKNNFVERINSLSYNERIQRMAENGRKFILDKYTHDKCAERLINKIKSIL